MNKLNAYAILAYGAFGYDTEAKHFDQLPRVFRDKLNEACCEISSVSIYGLLKQLRNEVAVMKIINEFDAEWPKVSQEKRKELHEWALAYFKQQLGENEVQYVRKMQAKN